ncbi:hypothetical protein D9757_008870 [Collybiopsis confluens]|uniref:C2H2-type domain-containing protein n=1 Tax=Collybiopsis confluens TaxID=2823264 RepID=A0A8H5H592_9AGAR|nr:hypothetical protein D9757_008870 [Collybiopsis confluens]
MSDFATYPALSHFDSLEYFFDKSKNLNDFAFADDLVLPLHPSTEEFDSELDSIIEGIDFDLLTVPTSNPEVYQHRQPPASAFTFSSSESSYDSARSESSYASSPRDTTSNYSIIHDLDSEFQSFGVEPRAQVNSLDCINPAVLDLMPSPSLTSVDSPKAIVDEPSDHRRTTSSFSDYGPSTANSLTSTSFAQQDHHAFVRSIPLMPFSTEDVHEGDPRRKFKCTAPGCPHGMYVTFHTSAAKHQMMFISAAFAKNYNLKTHMKTHDPDRIKPFVCPSCGYSSDRKSDVGRHETRRHRDCTPIGMGKPGKRTWCDDCGKSSISAHNVCDCVKSEEVKVK